jgi:hypothetical protein
VTPTARSLKKLREEGWVPDVVESYNAFTKRRKDFFGIADIVALKDKETLAVQATTDSNISSRVRKIEDAEHVDAVRKAGIRIEVWGWRKDPKKRKWVCRIVDLS